jgi:hypothetical protein
VSKFINVSMKYYSEFYVEPCSESPVMPGSFASSSDTEFCGPDNAETASTGRNYINIAAKMRGGDEGNPDRQRNCKDQNTNNDKSVDWNDTYRTYDSNDQSTCTNNDKGVDWNDGYHNYDNNDHQWQNGDDQWPSNDKHDNCDEWQTNDQQRDNDDQQWVSEIRNQNDDDNVNQQTNGDCKANNNDGQSTKGDNNDTKEVQKESQNNQISQGTMTDCGELGRSSRSDRSRRHRRGRERRHRRRNLYVDSQIRFERGAQGGTVQVRPVRRRQTLSRAQASRVGALSDLKVIVIPLIVALFIFIPIIIITRK